MFGFVGFVFTSILPPPKHSRTLSEDDWRIVKAARGSTAAVLLLVKRFCCMCNTRREKSCVDTVGLVEGPKCTKAELF